MATVTAPTTTSAFLAWLEDWYRRLPAASLAETIAAAGGPDRVAIVTIDVIVGFTSEGRLASPRIQAIVGPIRDFLIRAHDLGVRHILFDQDAHPPDSPEFRAFGPHCIAGTREAETAPELASLPFFSEVTVQRKRSLSIGIDTQLDDWLAARPQLHTFIVVGDCTDLCIYQGAMYLRLQANARGLEREVIVPANLVATFDVPVPTAEQLGILPHDGDLMHRLFLYHLALNGIRVVAELR